MITRRDFCKTALALPLGGALACYNVYECQDGVWLSLGALEPQFWTTFCRMAGHEEWIEHQRDSGDAGEPLRAALRDLFKTPQPEIAR